MKSSDPFDLFIRYCLVALLLLATSLVAHSVPGIADGGETRNDHPRTSDAEKLSAGGSHTCAVLADGSLWCWGRNNWGQLGLGDTTNRSSATRVGSASDWRSVSAGSIGTTCAVNTSNEVFCWGYNPVGQVGVSSSTTTVTTPTKVSALGTTVQSVSVGSVNSCVVTTAGAIRCWGSNSYGQLGTAVTIGQSTHVPTAIANLSGSYTQVAVNADTVCALGADKSVYCWGTDLWGQRGDNAAMTANDANPSKVSTTAVVVGLVSSGDTGSFCLITETSGVLCWGRNENNYLRGTAGNITTPSLLNVSPFYVSGTNVGARGFALGSWFACMLKHANAGLICGGDDNLSGVGATGRVANVPSGTGFLAVTTGTSHACALQSDRRLVCWGLNVYGQVGTGATGTSATATVVSFGAHATQVMGAEPVAPTAPRTVTATGNYRSIDVTWTAPLSVGTALISTYEYRYSTNSGTSWSAWVSFATTGTSGRISGLTPGTSHLVEVRAVTSEGVSVAAAAATAATPTSGCDPLKNCTIGAVGPNGGTIVRDAGAGTVYGRFIEAAPETWNGSGSDPWTYWQDATSRAANWRPSYPGSRLPTKDELISITAAYNDNPTLYAGWGISYADNYWSSTDPYEYPIDDGNGGYTYPDDEAYAGSTLRSKTWSYSVRPVIDLDGPSPLAAPTVTVTGSQLAISVSWSTPSIGTGGPITDYETRLSSNGGTSYGAWTSRGLVNSLELTGLNSGATYRVQVRAINFAGNGNAGQSSNIAMTSSLAPTTQTVSGVVNTAITDSSTFTTTNFAGAVSYAVTSGSLPAGLALASGTGVISGTPTAASSATITITATGSTTGTATTTVTFAITDPPPGDVGGVWAIDGLNGVVLEWVSPGSGVAPTSYQYAISTNGGQTFSAFATLTPSITTTFNGSQNRFTTTITSGLTRGTETVFQVRGMNGTTPGNAFPDPASAFWSTWGPRATAKISDSCDPMNDCDIGDVGPGGGVIVYDHGSNASWGRYIEAAPAFWNGSSGDPSASFGCSGSTITAVSATANRALGAGVTNTPAVMAGCSTAGIAARLADAYSATVGSATVSDWHLPSSEELQKLYSYRQYLGGWKYSVLTTDDRYYATSTDSNGTYFYGIGGSQLKFGSPYVRPVRYVAGPNAPSAPGLVATVGDGRINMAWASPSNNGGNAVSSYDYRLSSDGGQTWGSWSSLALATSRADGSLANGTTYVLEVRAVNRGGGGTASSTGTMVPGARQLSGVEGSAITGTSLFVEANLTTSASYAVTAGTLPAGLVLNPTTGLITGTPSVAGNSSVTITATLGSATASVDVQFAIQAAPTTTTSSTTTTTSPASPTTTSAPSSQSASGGGASSPGAGSTSTSSTIAPTANSSSSASGSSSGGSTTATTASPKLLTPTQQQVLTSPAGKGTMIIGGSKVAVDVVRASDKLRSTSEDNRSETQIQELRDLAKDMMSQVRAIIGVEGKIPVSIIETPAGAKFIGLITDPKTGRSIDVPVEHVVLIRGGGLLLMVAGSKGTEPARVGADGVLEISKGGVVSVLAYGLTPGVAGEVVVMSTPRLLKEFTVAGDGGAKAYAPLPRSLAVGSHTIVVTVGEDAASLGFRIIPDNKPAKIPVTGSQVTLPLRSALLLIAIGMLLRVRRRPARSAFD